MEINLVVCVCFYPSLLMPKQLFFPTEPSAFPQPSPTSPTSNTYRGVLFSFQKQVTLRTSAFQKHTKLTFSPPGYWKTQPKSKVPNVTWITAVCLRTGDGASPPCSSWACCGVPSLGTAGHAPGDRGRLKVSSSSSHRALVPLSHHPSPLTHPP